ncbi:hypothetical protein Pcinc_005301 [Petrolisthes cinctipes]|uniref:Uncharacterized protein n=1 Tax=Petrolisthes cinctipes TaxID=88211 RepID=A0AAE1L2V4_PETCI|nr:hypothetical protein Pcinc_005301 [Petrolisthes cinctipes]
MLKVEAGVKPLRAKSEEREKPSQPARRKTSVVVGPGKSNEPEYEEVGPQRHLKKPTDQRGDEQNCELCGSATAAVRCDRCGSQAFCLSCDDMFPPPPSPQHPRQEGSVVGGAYNSCEAA